MRALFKCMQPQNFQSGIAQFSSKIYRKDEEVVSAFKSHLNSLPVEERNLFTMTRIASMKNAEFESGSKCPQCWLLLRCCSCRPPAFESEMKHQILFYMHPKEYGKGSNTAIAILEALPQHASLCIVGLAEDEQRLEGLIRNAERRTESATVNTNDASGENEKRETQSNEKEKISIDEPAASKDQTDNSVLAMNAYRRVCVLTPSPASVTLNEYLQQKQLDITRDGILFVVLDGTWSQTKRLAKREILKDLPHVRLESAGLTMSNLRKQTNFGRITTGEAVMLLVNEMGKFPAEVDYLHERLQYRLSRAAVQKGRDLKKRRKNNTNEKPDGSSDDDVENEDEPSIAVDDLPTRSVVSADGDSMTLAAPCLKKTRASFESDIDGLVDTETLTKKRKSNNNSNDS